MTTAANELHERTRAPALWLVALGIAAATIAAVVFDARAGGFVLIGVLGSGATARLVLRGRRPVGLAVRDTWADVVVLAVLAVGIIVLLGAPGVT